MKTKNLLWCIPFFLIINSYSQVVNLEFTFSAVNNINYVLLDSVKVINRTQGEEYMIYWPDTGINMNLNTDDTLLFLGYSDLDPVVIDDMNEHSSVFSLSQNYPNPVRESSCVSLYLPDPGIVDISIADISGRISVRRSFQMNAGKQSFSFTPGSSRLYILTASWNGKTESIKILNSGNNTAKELNLELSNTVYSQILEKSFTQSNSTDPKVSGILDNPQENTSYTFQFAEGIPCPGLPTVTYGGQVYNTVQILSQCWLKENLNIGDMINEDVEMSNNGIIEKYCYDNEPDSCESLGGLYLWDEMMEYVTIQGSQGICPPGWHIPTDDEWKLLEGGVDSQYGIGDPEWDNSQYYRGFDAGYALKATYGWQNNGNGVDNVGFSAHPGGVHWYDGMNYFHTGGSYGNWWSSSEYSGFSAWLHTLGYDEDGSHRMPSGKDFGFSVRCLKDI